MRIGIAIILVLQHHIFKGDPPGIIRARISGAGGQQLLNPIFAVEGHDFVAHVFGDGMKRDGKVHPNFGARPRHHRHHAGCGERDPPFRQRQPIAIHHDFQRIAHIFKIIERLTHAHHHDVGQQPSLWLRRPFTQRIARQHDLPDNFRRSQIAHQLHRARMAKPAIERAAHLAGNTQRPAIRIGDEHHFIILRIGGAQQPFARAIDGDLRLHHLRPADHKPLLQPRVLGLGNIGHLGKAGGPAIIDPMPDLLGAQLRLTGIQPRLLQLRPNLVAPQANKVNTPIRAQNRRTRNGDGINMARNLHRRAYKRKSGQRLQGGD